MLAHVNAVFQFNSHCGTLSIEGLKKTEKRWLSDALMDISAASDAQFDEKEGVIRLENYGEPLSPELLKESIADLFQELSVDKFLITIYA